MNPETARLRALFDEAIQLPPAQRGKLLDALAAIARANELRAATTHDPAPGAGGSGPHPYDLAILAMSHFRLGHADAARAWWSFAA
jgi:hypothetical protein